MAQRVVFDAAVLDVNINRGRSYPIADELQRRGVPFLFATEFDFVHEAHRRGTMPRERPLKLPTSHERSCAGRCPHSESPSRKCPLWVELGPSAECLKRVENGRRYADNGPLLN